MKKIITIFSIICILFSSANMSTAKTKKEEQVNKYDYINISFWQKYNDDILINHLNKMYENNYDLKIAAYKLEESDKIVKLSLSNELPKIAFNGYVGRTLTSSDERMGDILIPDYAQYRYLLPLTLNYEVDLWGKNRLQTKSRKKLLEVQKEDERGLYISLTSNFAINYFNLIKTDKLIDIQDKLINNQEKICDYVKKRELNGLASKNEVINEEKNLTFLQEEKNLLNEKRDVLLNQINVFLGDRSFSEIERKDYESINYNINIPSIIDFNIVEKRPDVIKSNLKLQKAGYDVRISKKDLLPNFIITGNLGYNAYQLGNLFGTNTGLANIGVIPCLDIFTGGRKINTVKLMKTRYKRTFEEYNKNLLTAAQEVNDALYSAKTAKKNHKITNSRLDLQKQDTDLITKKEVIGTANIIDVLVKEQETLNIEKQQISSNINEIISTINLYKTIGGVDIFSETTIDL